MKQSRLFTEVLNDKDADEDDPRPLKKLRSLVQEWIDKGTLEQPSIGWLNSCFYPPKILLKPFKFAETPEVDFEHPKGKLKADWAATSFVIFLSEVAESLRGREKKSARAPSVKECPVCSDFFVQEAVGREKEFCSTKCLFRLRRAQEKLPPKDREILNALHRTVALGQRWERRLVKETVADLAGTDGPRLEIGLSLFFATWLNSEQKSKKMKIYSLSKQIQNQQKKS